MNTLTVTDIDTRSVLALGAHPDDIEMFHSGLLEQAEQKSAYVATRGEATTLNYSGRLLC